MLQPRPQGRARLSIAFGCDTRSQVEL